MLLESPKSDASFFQKQNCHFCTVCPVSSKRPDLRLSKTNKVSLLIGIDCFLNLATRLICGLEIVDEKLCAHTRTRVCSTFLKYAKILRKP